MRFEWHATKATANRRKHGVSFDEAVSVFADPLALIGPDRAHPERFTLLGLSERSRVLFVVYVEKEHDDTIRLISARRATRAEREAYEEDAR